MRIRLGFHSKFDWGGDSGFWSGGDLAVGRHQCGNWGPDTDMSLALIRKGRKAIAGSDIQ